MPQSPAQADPMGLLALSRANARWTGDGAQGAGATSLRPHLAPEANLNPVVCTSRKTKRGRIRICDLRVMRLILGIGWTTWGTILSGFREIDLRGDRLESVGLLAPFLAPGSSYSPPIAHGGNRLQTRQERRFAGKVAHLRPRRHRFDTSPRSTDAYRSKVRGGNAPAQRQALRAGVRNC
jgi:hypothetical protein